MGKRFRRRGRTDEEIVEGRKQRARREDLAARHKERVLLTRLLAKGEVEHDGLTPERKNELQLALKTPPTMPNTPSEIAADRERRAKAVLEINGYLQACSHPPSSETKENGLSGTLNDSKHIAPPGRRPEPKTEMDRNRISKKKKDKGKKKVDGVKQSLDVSKDENGGDGNGFPALPIRHRT